MILESVLPAITEYVAKKVADKLFHAPRDNPEKPVKDRIKSALEVHVNRIANWSSSVGLYRMPAQKSVEIGTVPLLFSATPRRFRSAADSGKIYTELDLLSASQHLLILGPPGAGKTTALKRIARAILTDEPTGPLDTYQVPILLRLREIDFTSVEVNPIMAALAFELGLFVKIPEERLQVELLQKDGSKKIEERVRRGAPLCENMPMQQLLPRLMDEINPILLLDGLDEVTPGARASVEKDIEILLENSGTYKVLVTCRSGEYATPINGMDVIEVCDLQTHDVKILSQQWLGDRSDLFLQKVENTSLADLSTRPLFLTHMLVLFDIEGTLPDQPFELYELIVSLMIREWDRERKIARVSKYSDFGPEKKRRFLSSLAYYLTYKSSLKVFTESDLIRIYDQIHRSFGLPADEARLVATEIESHTGLIAEAGNKHYEFSHLTLQEYLCAEHLSRSPFPANAILRLLTLYPAPLAIATALSADPIGWLSGILLSEKIIDARADEAVDQKLIVFLDRLEFENPTFVGGPGLGLCMLSLCFTHSKATAPDAKNRIEKYLAKFMAMKTVRTSFVDVVTSTYRVSSEQTTHGYYYARIATPTSESSYDFELPVEYSSAESGLISSEWIQKNFHQEILFEGIHLTRRR